MRYSELQMSSELLDQPPFAGKPRKIFICSTPRSGSYLLCRFMINAGLGVPHEYFNPIIMRQIAPRFGLGEVIVDKRKSLPLRLWQRTPLGRAVRRRERAREIDFLARYVKVLIQRRCQSGIFAAKIHFDQYRKVLDNPVGRELFEDGLFIHLYRENLLNQAVSTHFANMTGRWSIDDTITTVPESNPNFFDVDAIDRTLSELSEDDRGWRVFLSRNGISPIMISYEALCQDPLAFVATIARRLGIDPDALPQGYVETETSLETDPNLPRKGDVAKHFLARVSGIRGRDRAEMRVPKSPAARKTG